MSKIIIPRPEWTPCVDGFEFRWPTYGVVIKVSRIRERGEGISGELAIMHETHVVDIFRLSFLTPRERSTLANHLKNRSEGIEWADMLTAVSAIVAEEYRREEPIEDTATGEVQARSYLTEPTLKHNVLTAFFGNYAEGKTTLAYLHAIAVAYNFTLPGGIHPVRTGRALIYDYEMGSNDAKASVRALLRGFEIPLEEDRILYRHLVHPLADSAEYLRAEIARLEIALIVLDSQGQAMNASAQGDPGIPVREMARALRSFGTAAIIIGQVAKGESRRDGAREPYGARAISYEVHDSWEIRGQADPEKKTLVTSMFHRKHRGPAYPPFTFTIEYPQDGVTLVRAGGVLEDSTEPHGQVSQITSYLMLHGMATPDEISKGTKIEANAVRSVLSRYRGRKFAKTGDQWTVLGAQHPTENEG